MRSTFIVTTAAGSHRDQAQGTREQPYWDEHAACIDRLVKEGFIVLGGPLPDEGGAVLVVRADSEAASVLKKGSGDRLRRHWPKSDRLDELRPPPDGGQPKAVVSDHGSPGRATRLPHGA